MWFRKTLVINSNGRGMIEITLQVADLVHASGIGTGLCQVFVQHTSASLLLCENADPSVREDLERFMTDLVPDGAQRYLHGQEGDDDMPAHIRTVLSENSLSMPVEHARLMLGTCQGIYLWEHRTHACQRNIVVTVFGN